MLLALGLGQLFSALGLSSTLSVGALMAVDLTGSEAFGGAPTTALALGGALGALPLASRAVRRGRRAALTAGISLAVLGALLLLLAPIWQSVPAMLAGAALIGFGFAANLQSRFAATDLADDSTRARDLGLVMWAITIGAVAGPNLVRAGSDLGLALGLPALSGPFVLATVGLAMALAVLEIGLRPDPLLTARAFSARDAGRPDVLTPDPSVPDRSVPGLAVSHPAARASRSGQERPPGAGQPPASPHAFGTGLAALRESAPARLGVATIIAAHMTMVAVMAMTPVHLQHLVEASHTMQPTPATHHVTADTLVLVGIVISLHVAGMFGLSPVMGWLADRYGRLRLMAGAQLLFAAAVLTAGLGQAGPRLVAAGLVLLGLGWSMATVSASAYIAESVRGAAAVPVQGVSDMLMGFAGAIGAAGGGLVLALGGFGWLNLAALAVILAIAALLANAVARAPGHGHSPRPAAGT
ncbi:MFS transporter [Arthrobacter ginkgonis]|uniref:MFS transporter n=2 Tax=Arthrobacter ginkgonis TaxID=1630594 RepID=A0ABP7CGF8_9MICC